MGLLDNKTQEIYYTGSQVFIITAALSSSNNTYSLTNLESEYGSCLVVSDIRVYVESGNSSFTNREIFDFTISDSVLTITSAADGGDGAVAFGDIAALSTEGELRIELRHHSFGGYRHTSLADIVSSFMVAYVGDGKLITNVAKSDVLFHARRGIAEFSYDVLKTVKVQEVELSTSLSIPMPQDYVSYIKLSFIGSDGIKRIIYPTRLTVNPTEAPTQDSDYNYVYDGDGNIISGDSYTETKWQAYDTDNITGNINANDDYFVGRDDRLDYSFGGRHGLEPEHQQINGYFTIDERTGSFAFSSDLSGKIITIEYVSDSLGTDAEMKVHKFAEEALYKHIAFNVLATKRNIPEYIVQRYKKERRAALRNAKLRLSKLNLEYMAQVMRGKGKQIKN
tara:strand:+ start:133 stop:1314 length:1182 start_codon:yes stop_codon:yes gene_type:complete